MSIGEYKRQELTDLIDTAIRSTARLFGPTRQRITASVAVALGPEISNAFDAGVLIGDHDGALRGLARSADLTLNAERRGYEAGRRDALAEAATMLKRHGHRTAVDRVTALATPTVDTDTGQPPADAPRPAPSPQKGTFASGAPAPGRGRPEAEVHAALIKASEGHA